MSRREVSQPVIPQPPPILHGIARSTEFTYTFFYGSWNGQMIFAEPMITKAFLESRESLTVALPPAAQYGPAGLHARGYRVYWEGGRHRVAPVQLAP